MSVMPETTFKIIQNIATLSRTKSGWTKEINLVSWNGNPPKYDIRRFSPEGRANKGIMLDEDEIRVLKGVLNDLSL